MHFSDYHVFIIFINPSVCCILLIANADLQHQLHPCSYMVSSKIDFFFNMNLQEDGFHTSTIRQPFKIHVCA